VRVLRTENANRVRSVHVGGRCLGRQASPGTCGKYYTGSYPVLNVESIVVRVSIRAVAIAVNRHVRSSTSKGFLITGARTRVSSILHPIVRSSKKMKLKCCESSGKSSCWSVDSFIADVNVVRHSTFDVGKCKSQLSRRAMNTNTNLHLIFHTLCIELAAI
jgi:hypothetical protein